MGTLTADCPRLNEHCPHKLATSCRLTSTPNCCACADERVHSRTYRVYIDGVGFVQRGTRWQGYCWFCKEFWTNRLAATDPPLDVSQTRIPETPDQTEFLARWNEFHQGYRTIMDGEGREQRIAVIGEPFKEVSPGFLPRTLDQMRSGVENNARRPENRFTRRRLSSDDARPEEPQQSVEDALDGMLQELENEVAPSPSISAPQTEIAQSSEPTSATGATLLPQEAPQDTRQQMRANRDQRARERFARLFGNREDVQRDEYESPLTTMYSRAYDRYERAEERRAEGTYIAPPLEGLSAQERREVEEQILWGVMRESRRAAAADEEGEEVPEHVRWQRVVQEREAFNRINELQQRAGTSALDEFRRRQARRNASDQDHTRRRDELERRMEAQTRMMEDSTRRLEEYRDLMRQHEQTISLIHGSTPPRLPNRLNRPSGSSPTTRNTGRDSTPPGSPAPTSNAAHSNGTPRTTTTQSQDDVTNDPEFQRALEEHMELVRPQTDELRQALTEGLRREWPAMQRVRRGTGQNTRHTPSTAPLPPPSTSTSTSDVDTEVREFREAMLSAMREAMLEEPETSTRIPLARPPWRGFRRSGGGLPPMPPSEPVVTLDSQPDRPPPATDEDMTKTLTCQVCYAQLANIALLPCGHMVMCQWCADVVIPERLPHIPARSTAKCPICRAKVKQRYKIHL